MFQNTQIRSKILVILLLPVACLGLLAAIQTGINLGASRAADRAHDAAAYAADVTALIHELQRERALAVGYAAGGQGSALGDLVTQRDLVSQAVEAVRGGRDRLALGDDGQPLADRVNAAVELLGSLETTRVELDGQRGGDAPAVARDAYGQVISSLVGVTAEIAVTLDDRDLARQFAAVEAITRAKETAASESALLYGALVSGQLPDADARALAGFAGAHDELIEQFSAAASTAQRELYAQTVLGPASDQVAELRDQALAAPGNLGVIDPGVWLAASEAKVDALRAVEREGVADALAAAGDAQAAARQRAWFITGLVVLVVGLSVGLALIWARSMTRSLRALRSAAQDVAGERLPALMEQLEHPELVARGAAERAETALVPVQTADEIGQVAEAFNAVHQAAIQAADDQAAMRRAMGDLFLNLARRNQAMIDRQLEVIDDLGRTEADPDRLEQLFRLDHLATRMRRTAEDLVVLSGAKPARRWTEPVGLSDVLRTALAEVEEYTRIDVLPVDDLALVGQAVEDVVHLLAELLENATNFSPPGSRVRVAGQAVSSGYVIEIEDRGIGMSDAELAERNERLAHQDGAELADSPKLGHHVVARLADRYGIKVQLRHSWYGGVTALVLLGEELLVAPAANAGPAVPPHPELALPAPGRITPGDPYGDPGDGPPALAAAESANGFPEPSRRPLDTVPPLGARLRLPYRLADMTGPKPPAEPAMAPGPDPGTSDDDMTIRTEQASTNTLPRRVPGAGSRRLSARQRGGRPDNQPPKTASGLPRRVPRASLASGIPSSPAERPEPVAALHRTPDDIRSLLSRYRTGFERGRNEASGADEPPTGPVPSPYSRSDDDAVE